LYNVFIISGPYSKRLKGITVIKRSLKKAEKRVVRSGFTLLELLVVISIISLLMSIMLPGLNRSREQAQRVVCGSNMRQLTMCWTMYAYDNDDRLCSADTGFNFFGEGNWVADGPLDLPGNFIGGTEQALKDGVLFGCAQTAGLYKCPTDPSYRLRSYSISRAMNGKTCNCEHDNIRPYVTWTSIARPTTKMVFVDTTAQTEWMEGSFCPVEDVTAANPVWYQRISPSSGLVSRSITARHAEGCNISFVDMHYEYLKWKDRRTIELAEFQRTAAQASAYNRDLVRILELMGGLQ
jgi:prepilin-type N-terminal cleavage/methylation domain-containing protein